MSKSGTWQPDRWWASSPGIICEGQTRGEAVADFVRLTGRQPEKVEELGFLNGCLRRRPRSEAQQ